jgi:predicted enzyme related to lactoylglutathione lyase
MTAKLAHFEITAPDDTALVSFYADLLGWPTDSKGPGYTLVQPDGGPGGAIVGAAEARVVLGVTVDDLDGVVTRATQLGGTVMMPATDNGWVVKALIRDPAGNLISLIEDKPAPGR